MITIKKRTQRTLIMSKIEERQFVHTVLFLKNSGKKKADEHGMHRDALSRWNRKILNIMLEHSLFMAIRRDEEQARLRQ